MDSDLLVREKTNGCNDDLLSDFLREVSLQAKSLEILEGMDKGNAALCNRLNDELLLFKTEISTLAGMLEMQKKEFEEQKALSSRLEELSTFLDYIENNIPQHFTYIPDVGLLIEGDDSPLSYVDDEGDDGYEDSCTSASPCSISQDRLFAGSFIQSPMGIGINSPFVEQKQIFEMQKPIFEIQTPLKDHHRSKPKLSTKAINTKSWPTVAYLTQEEFNSIPPYMKGRTRLTYNSVNIFIDTFNTALNKKYKIMSQPASSLRMQDKQIHMMYKKQENHETKGKYFITEEDIKNSGQVKAINTFNSLMSILRSYRRMYEVRGGGLVRFVVITGN